MVPAPKKYEEFLKEAFGLDYMTPVMSPSMHGLVVFDTERSYVELLPKVRKEYRNSAFRRLKEKK
jgi:lipopolysaccharide cholinephosphotransferase